MLQPQDGGEASGSPAGPGQAQATLSQLPDANLLVEQDVTTTCDGCQLSSHTCLLTPACSSSACLAWQEFQLDSPLPVIANRSYIFFLTGLQSRFGTLPSVGVSVPSENHGGASNLPTNTKLLHHYSQVRPIQPGAAEGLQCWGSGGCSGLMPHAKR